MSKEQGTRNKEQGAAGPGSMFPVPGSWDIIGQERAVAVLRRAVEDEARLSHAYLFVEAGGAVSPPWGECRACRLIAEDKHPDVEWVIVGGVCEEPEHRDHSADSSRDIRICQVRRLERVVSRTTVDARYRVIIVDPADAMTVEAANAFLKTLEEPARSAGLRPVV